MPLGISFLTTWNSPETGNGIASGEGPFEIKQLHCDQPGPRRPCDVAGASSKSVLTQAGPSHVILTPAGDRCTSTPSSTGGAWKSTGDTEGAWALEGQTRLESCPRFTVRLRVIHGSIEPPFSHLQNSESNFSLVLQRESLHRNGLTCIGSKNKNKTKCKG